MTGVSVGLKVLTQEQVRWFETKHSKNGKITNGTNKDPKGNTCKRNMPMCAPLGEKKALKFISGLFN